jgi:uncharacterized C2H2 Zn-finger protein
MIGDVPKGAPLRCRLGRHTGQQDGGTMVYMCPRCGGSYWQPHDYSAVTRYADLLIANGQSEEALRFARDAVATPRSQASMNREET